jgi:2-methylcitrate dehydratase PrpD
MAAQYSLPFVVGATIEFGPARYDAFASSNLQNPSILRWADLVEVEFDRDLQEQYPAHFGTEVEVGFKDGSKRTERILDSRGTPALPFSWNDLHIKAASLTAGSAIPLDLDRLEQVVRHLSEAPEISEFEGLWAGTPPESRGSGAHQSAGETSASIARL